MRRSVDSCRTEDALGIFWRFEDGHEEVSGFELHGLWTNAGPPPDRPASPAHLWPPTTEFAPIVLHGAGWVTYGWDVRIHDWPTPAGWLTAVAATLEQQARAGACIGWMEVGEYFTDPPDLFRPANGIFAALSAPTGFVCSAIVGQDVAWLDEGIQQTLHDFANSRIDPSAPDPLDPNP